MPTQKKRSSNTRSSTAPKTVSHTAREKTKKTPSGKKNTAKISNAKDNASVEKRQRFSEQYMPYILGGVGFILTVLFFLYALSEKKTPDESMAGFVGHYLCYGLLGLFGWVAYLIPVILFNLAIFWRKYCREQLVALELILSGFLMVLVSAVIHVCVCSADPDMAQIDMGFLFREGATFRCGGVIGGLVGFLLYKGLRIGGTIAIAIVTLPLIVMILVGVTPAYVFEKIKKASAKARARREAEEAEEELEAPPREKRVKSTRAVKEATAATTVGNQTSEAPLQDTPDGRCKTNMHTVQVDTETGEIIENPDTDKPAEKRSPFGRKKAERSTPDITASALAPTESEEDEEDELYVPSGASIEVVAQRSSKTVNAHEKYKPDTVGEPEADAGEDTAKDRLYVPASAANGRSDRVKKSPRTRGPLSSEHNPKVALPDDERPPFDTEDGMTDDTPFGENVYGETESMEVSFDDEPNDYLAETPASGNVRVLSPEESAARRPEQAKKREEIVVMVNPRDRSAVTDTTDIRVNGLPDEELVIPPSAGEPEVEATDETAAPAYNFPPIDLLARGSDDYGADEAEIARNTEALRDVLEDFHIRVKEISCSCGPTITRFEVRPDTGVRVRSIANLVDDIALGLAKSGVRIEAPIPGKPAVGIEVPNEHAATVYLRNLIETPEFKNHKSRIAACLGADVSGRPVIFDINKMPHLLVAGATGMGKSVCINCFIMSILYKAKPDEVKLILIDPKKVEFNMYRDLPHLYAPIVSDPKKAAGALNSAVNEMERRFELIEEVGVRNLAGYNEVTAGDPERPPLPQIVIIIDEFADLMMTASQEVETAVCRLAQKARAAGIHLIIGTQRPSVNVITGLIKANIPSRIACTVTSAVDSRTIIDTVGAEKLIGRGDMLYAPVGSPKPMRVQGAFVSDSEVERVVSYISEHNERGEFDESFTREIEIEAAKCAAGKKKGGGGGDASDFEALGGDDQDSKYWEAVEVAVDAQKISTSLLQRRLNLGYGRAAKIIDRMEEMGFVGPADGNKPRKLLITKQDLMEMRISGRNSSDEF